MRTRLSGMVAALLLVTAGAWAQSPDTGSNQDTPKPSTTAADVQDITFENHIDFGFRGTSYGSNSDEARRQRYQDLRDGAFIDHFRFTKNTPEFLFNAQADHVGYRDQRFAGSYNGYGRVKASFEWNQIPLFYSQDTRTLYSESAPGVLTLSDAVQTGRQSNTITLAQAALGASLFDTRSKRSVADFNATVSANRNLDLTFSVKNTLRDGTQPFGAGFGFTQAIEVAAPVDNRTTEFNTGLEFSNDRGFAKVNYEGSFFRNNVGSLTWDNPNRISDSPTAGPLQGRMALWPNSDSNTVSATGSIVLPARSRATAYLSVGQLSQNDTLLPMTSNTALPVIPLERATADAKATVTAMNYSFTSRPTNLVWLNLRYRQYQFDNKTALFEVGNLVNYDTSVVAFNGENEPLGYTRHTFDADTSITPFTYLAFRGGYTRESVDRTFRVVEGTTEDTGRLSADLTGIGWLTLRGVYEHGKRTGSGIDTAELIAIGEQPSLRQFDIADRNRDRFSAILSITPVNMVSFNASAGVGKEDYPATDTRTVFGLRNNDNHIYSVGFDFVPLDSVNLGLSYGYEKYTALQTSRTANPLPAGSTLNDTTQQFNDSRRDWSDDSADKVHTFNASMDLTKVLPKTDVKVAYDYSKAQSTYVYGLAPNTTLVAPVQLPTVLNELQRGTVDVRYFLTKHLAAGIVYWFDKYDVNDFALGPQVQQNANGLAQPSFLMLGYTYRPYSANTVWGRLTYLW